MREILFRGKAINRIKGREYRTNYKNGDWVYGLVSKLYDERFPLLPAEMTNTNGVTGIDVDYRTISEFTGLTDKNGTRIFEGDLCLCDRHINDRFDKHVFEIKFDPMRGFYGENFNEIEAYEFCLCEIIGNIYDNPELLK